MLESLDPGLSGGGRLRGGSGTWPSWRWSCCASSAGFVALGTLMSVGLMMLPAIAARHWSGSLAGQVSVAVGLAVARRYWGC